MFKSCVKLLNVGVGPMTSAVHNNNALNELQILDRSVLIQYVFYYVLCVQEATTNNAIVVVSFAHPLLKISFFLLGSSNFGAFCTI